MKNEKHKQNGNTHDNNGLSPEGRNNGKIWKVKGEGDPVLEVLEAHNGDLYFIVDKLEDGEIFCYARLYNMPQFAEWGWNRLNYLKVCYGENRIWNVPKENWGNINTYEDGLLVQVIK